MGRNSWQRWWNDETEWKKLDQSLWKPLGPPVISVWACVWMSLYMDVNKQLNTFYTYSIYTTDPQLQPHRYQCMNIIANEYIFACFFCLHLNSSSYCITKCSTSFTVVPKDLSSSLKRKRECGISENPSEMIHAWALQYSMMFYNSVFSQQHLLKTELPAVNMFAVFPKSAF